MPRLPQADFPGALHHVMARDGGRPAVSSFPGSGAGGHDHVARRRYEARGHGGKRGDSYPPKSVDRVTKDQQTEDVDGVRAATEIDPAVFSASNSLAHTVDLLGLRPGVLLGHWGSFCKLASGKLRRNAA